MSAIMNSKGKRWFGLHFYSGVAQYQEADGSSYRVYLNEDTLRKMDQSFAVRPVFVEHVDDVEPDVNKLRKEADGWVIRSFFNESDGKHWCEFITVTDHAERAIRSGFRLSNAYIPKSFKEGGLWNGVPYQKEIVDGEYEHLAIVKDPRYEESIILTPDEFAEYNRKNILVLQKLSNSRQDKPKGKSMKFSFFKKQKVENAVDPELLLVLPTGRTITLADLIENAYSRDEIRKQNEGHQMADENHMVKMHDGAYMKVKDMLQKHKQMSDELEELRGKKQDSDEKELDLKPEKSDVDVEGDEHNSEDEAESEEKKEKDDSLEHPEEPVHDEEDSEENAEDPEEDKAAKKKALQLAEHEDKELEEAKAKNKKKNEGKLRAERLKNAHLKAYENQKEPQTLDLSYDMVDRGKKRYGS